MTCHSCGQPMRDDQSFCLSCGAPVTPPAGTSPKKGSNTMLLAVLGAFAALLLIGGGVAAMQHHSPATPDVSKTTTTVAVTTSTPTETPTPEKSAESPSASPTEDEGYYIPLEMDYLAGDWLPGENVPSKKVLKLMVVDDTWVGVGDKYALSLKNTKGDDRLGGTAKLGDNPVTVKGSISRDGNELRLTLVKDSGETEDWTFERPYNMMRPHLTPEDLANAETYLPALYTVRKLTTRFADDPSQGVALTETTTVLQRGILRTVLSATSEGDVVYHFIARSDGVYKVLDSSPDEATLWLPNNLAVGSTWNDGSYDCEVLAMDESVDLGFDKFPCLKVKRENAAVEVVETAYYAPGYGEVLVSDGRGFDAVRLDSEESLTEGGGATDVGDKALNIDKIKP